MGGGDGSFPALPQVLGRGIILVFLLFFFTASFQARNASAQDASLISELEVLEKAIEGRQFVAHANSILETEATTEKVHSSQK